MQTAAIETFTPQAAQDYIDSMPPNRRSSPRNVSKMARDMRRPGGWDLNGETIKFTSDNRLWDGQNRMLACIEAGVPFTSWVIRGIETRDNVDTGEKRTLANKFQLTGQAHATTLAAAIGWYYRLVNTPEGVTPVTSITPTHTEAYEVQNTTAIQGSLDIIMEQALKSTQRLHGPSVFIALHCIWRQHYDKALVDTFFERLLTGIGVEAESPVFLLRNRLGDPKARHSSVEVAALTIKAFTAERIGRKMETLRWRRTGKGKERFPDVDAK